MSQNPINIEHCTVEPNALKIDAKTYEDWEGIGRDLIRFGSALNWLVGDWINYGRENHEKTYAKAIEKFCTNGTYDPNTVYRWGRVAEYFDFSHRCLKLSWTHHFVLCDRDLSNKARMRLLAEASEKEWSVADLKRAIKTELCLESASSGHVVKSDFDTRLNAITAWVGGQDVTKWEPDRLESVHRRLSDGLEVLVPFANRVADEIERRRVA